jgi:hypothetical protein
MIGTTVLYKLAAFDAALINARRDDARAYARKHRGASAPEIEPGDPGRTGHVEHVGNDTYWATSRVEGTEPSQWTRLP